MWTLEQGKPQKNSKTFFGNGGWLGIARTVTYELAALAASLTANPQNLAVALKQNSHTYNFPAVRSNSLLLVDESLGLPVSLGTVLQTAVLYEGQDWADVVTRQCAAMDFLQEFLDLFLPETIKLLALQRIGLTLSAANLLVVVERGKPMMVQLREVSGIFQSEANLPGFVAVASRDELYEQFRSGLLVAMLRPFIQQLVEISGASAEILWDAAIGSLFQALLALPGDVLTKERLRLALMLEELDMGERIAGNFAPFAATGSGFSPFSGDNLVYLKRKCCKKFKKGKRCDDCPGRKKK